MTNSPCPPHPHPAFGDGGHAWPALLALTQANRDAAAALLFAMKAFGHASEHAMQPDELLSWYTDAHDAADVASHAVLAFQHLTTNASTVPAASGVHPAHVAGTLTLVDNGDNVSPPCTPRSRRSVGDDAVTVSICTPIRHPLPADLAKVHGDGGDIGSPPCTPRCHSGVVGDARTVNSFTPIKHPPPPVHDVHDRHASGASALLDSPPKCRPVDGLVSEEVCGRLPRPPEARPLTPSPTPACCLQQGGSPGSCVGDRGTNVGNDGKGDNSCSAYSVDTVAVSEGHAVDLVDTSVGEAAEKQVGNLVDDSPPPFLPPSNTVPWWRLPVPSPSSNAPQLVVTASLAISEGYVDSVLQTSDAEAEHEDDCVRQWHQDWILFSIDLSPLPALIPSNPLPWWCLPLHIPTSNAAQPEGDRDHEIQAPRGRNRFGDDSVATPIREVVTQAASLSKAEPDLPLVDTQDFCPPPLVGAAQSASLRMLEPDTHLPNVTTLDLGAQTDVPSVLFDLPPMSPPDGSLKAEEVCGRLPRPPEARSSCDAQAASLPSSSHLPPSHVDIQDNGLPPQESVAAQGYGPPPQDGAAQSTSLPNLEPGTHLSQVATRDIGPPPQPVCSHGVGPVCAPSRCCVAVTEPGDRNCANEVDPVCLHSRSCANELGPDELHTCSCVSGDVPDLTRPSYANVVATGCARSCANGIVPDSGSCAIDPAVTADAYIASAFLEDRPQHAQGAPICPCCFCDGDKVALESRPTNWCPVCQISWSPEQAARFNDLDDYDALAGFSSGIEGTDPATGNKVPPNSAKGGHCRRQRRSRRR